jgi:prefoldin subunit 5
MSTTEQKLDFLINEVKTLQVNQLKMNTTIDELNKWSSDVDKVAVDLSNDIKSLISCITALEALSSTPVP